MGANQSKQPFSNEKLVIERLRALELKDQADNEYIQVGEKDVAHPARNSQFRAPWTTLSISDVGEWESELMQDPKNRSVLHSQMHQSNQTTNNCQTRTVSSELCRPQDRSHISINNHQGPADLLCQDPIRRGSYHKPEIFRSMLAVWYVPTPTVKHTPRLIHTNNL